MHAERYAQLIQALEQIVYKLSQEYEPDKIILFGSLATGEVGEWSDIDLAIIKETPKPFIKRSVEVALLCMAPVGVDYFVYTPSEFAQMITDNNHFIVNEIVKKGKVIYERSPVAAMAG